MTIFTHFNCIWIMCGHIELFGTCLYLGRAPRTKETLSDFRE